MGIILQPENQYSWKPVTRPPISIEAINSAAITDSTHFSPGSHIQVVALSAGKQLHNYKHYGVSTHMLSLPKGLQKKELTYFPLVNSLVSLWGRAQ